eukprot:COSAG01_NODE_6224_length_3781_cov_3.878327_1_plen_328_part_00
MQQVPTKSMQPEASSTRQTASSQPASQPPAAQPANNSHHNAAPKHIPSTNIPYILTMMKINNSLFALCMCTGLALAAGTPIVGARAAAHDDACASLPQLLASATATHAAVCSAMDDWSDAATEQRTNVENVQQELQSAKGTVPGLTADRDQADTAVTEQEAECTSTQAAYEAAGKAVADKYKECDGHADTNPCRDEIADLLTAWNAAGLANGNCGQELNQRKDALDTAQKALDNALALVTSLTLELAQAMSNEEKTLIDGQNGVNEAHAKQTTASATCVHSYCKPLHHACVLASTSLLGHPATTPCCVVCVSAPKPLNAPFLLHPGI